MVEESKEAVDLFDQSYLETAWEWKCSKSNIEYPTNWEGETAEGNTYAKECAEIENSDWQRKWKVDCSEFKLLINADSTFCASMLVFDYDKPGPDAVEGSLKVSGTYVRQGQIIVCDVKERNQTGSQDLQHLKE